MSMILYNAGKIKAFENLKYLVHFVGESDEFADELWKNMLADEELLDEFNYYVVNKTLKGTAKCGELTLLDLYFSQMNSYNYMHDTGKNGIGCNKEQMILQAFATMIQLRKNPYYLAEYLQNERKGMDLF